MTEIENVMLQLIDQTDIFVFIGLVLLHILYRKKKINSCLFYSFIIIIIIIGFILPIWSISREIDRNIALNGNPVDNF